MWCRNYPAINDSDVISRALLRQLKIFRESRVQEPVVIPEPETEENVYSRLKPQKKKKELAKELGVSRTTL